MLKRDSMLGDPLNFKTVKDRIIFACIKGAYSEEVKTVSTSIEQIRGHLQALG